MRIQKILSSVLALGLAFSALADIPATGYNEIFFENGQVRPIYREVYEIWSKMTKAERRKFLADSRKAFLGDNALDPLPRVISAEEYDSKLKAGVTQRAEALMAFLQDHYSGRREYLKNRIIPEEVIERIMDRSAEAGYDGLIHPEIVSFMYGPDIIKDAQGRWRIIEDNPGYIGGVGDLKLAQNFLMSHVEGLSQAIKYRPADEFYEKLAERFKKRATEHGGIAVIYSVPPYADHEDNRIRDILEDLGIESVSTYSHMQFKIDSSGVYIYDKREQNPKYQKVGFVFLNGEHRYLDPTHPVTYENLVMQEVRNHLRRDTLDAGVREDLMNELFKSKRDVDDLVKILNRSNFINDVPVSLMGTKQARGLTQAILDRKVSASYSPGVDFVGDKEFYLYVEKLIRFYLKEDPILRNIPTQRFADEGSGRLKKDLYDRVFGNLEKYVIKDVTGRGGDSVWVGPKVKKEEIPNIRKAVRANPSGFIAQEYTPLSRLNDMIGDIRVIAHVGDEGVFVADTPWGRGLPARGGTGKVNLSGQGREIAVLVREECGRAVSGNGR